MNNLETYSTLVASTAHLEQRDINILTMHYLAAQRDTGIFLKIYEELDDIINLVSNWELSNSFEEFILFAWREGVSCIEFDADGPIYQGFKIHEW